MIRAPPRTAAVPLVSTASAGGGWGSCRSSLTPPVNPAAGGGSCRSRVRRRWCQYLYFCTSKAREVSTWKGRRRRWSSGSAGAMGWQASVFVLLYQCLYFCRSKASKLSAWIVARSEGGRSGRCTQETYIYSSLRSHTLVASGRMH